MKKFLILFSIGLFANSAMAQYSSQATNKPTAFVLGIVDQLQSKELGENRTLNIYLPQGYSPDSAKKYPVIYLLDGSANEDFVHIVGIVQFLTMIEKMEESIVVGIANVDRKRDFTFPTTVMEDKKDFPTTGSSARFITFIEKELQPFIQKKYRVNHSATIIGQSLGGLLATEILLKKPGLFNNYIIVSPSLWWDNESLLTIAPQLLEKQDDKKTRVYISVGTEGKQMEDDAKHLTEILRAAAKKNLHTEFMPLQEETHLTILHNSVYKGFLLLLASKIETKN